MRSGLQPIKTNLIKRRCLPACQTDWRRVVELIRLESKNYPEEQSSYST